MRVIEAELAEIRLRHGLKQDVTEALIGWAKRAYTVDHIDLEEMERIVSAALSGDALTWLHPGERVLSTKAMYAPVERRAYVPQEGGGMTVLDDIDPPNAPETPQIVEPSE